MYKTKGVIFEHYRIFPKRYWVFLVLWGILPFECLLCGVPEVQNHLSDAILLLVLLGFIAWIPLGIILIIAFKNAGKKIYRYFPVCSKKYRHDATLEFDFERKPGKVCCKMTSPLEKSSYFKTVTGIRYDEMTKVLIFTWISNVSLSAGGRYGVQPKGTIVYVAIGAPDSVEIMKLMRENGGEGVGTFDTEMATYVAWALKE